MGGNEGKILLADQRQIGCVDDGYERCSRRRRDRLRIDNQSREIRPCVDNL
jgi:hypothetical protein